MRKHLISLFVMLIHVSAFSQELKWNTKLDFFFDNTEFSKSNLTVDQTLAGVALAQEIGWKFDGKHYVMAGVDVTKSLGGHDVLNDIHLLAYYQLKDENILFKVGSFYRRDLLDDYSVFFFQDSVNFYKDAMDGIYFSKGNDKQFVKLWLDWTGLQSETERENFFVGASGYKEFGKLFFADFQSYMFHFATTRPNVENLTVSDNLLGQASVGIKHSNSRGLNNLKFSLGVLSGFERDRKDKDNYQTPIGGTARLDIDYKGFGTENLFYYGQKRMTLYEKYGNQLYWGTPFLRSNTYFQNKLYWNFLDSRRVKGQIATRTHLSEGKIFFEQMLTLCAQINNYEPKKARREPTLWERIFPKQERLDGIMM